MTTMGKNSPALFELVRDPGVNQKSMPVAQQVRPTHLPPKPMPTPTVTVQAPKPRVVLSTAPKPRVEAEPVGAGPAAAPARAEVGAGGGRLSVSMTTLSIAAVAVVVLAVIVYSSGYRMGQAKEARQAQQELERAGVRDPLRGDGIPVNPALVTPAPGSQAGTPARPAPQNPPVARQNPASPPAPTQVSGPLADTREAGLNYCVAASRLDKAAAERAAAFIREGGLPAIAVLEGTGSGSNNATSWKVVVLQGVTAQEYRERAPVRTRVESELTKLGEVYRRDPKGRVNFGQFAWEKKKD
jgi:hypothetical protein